MAGPRPPVRDESSGSELARAAVAPQIAQRTMHHGDDRTTLRHTTVSGLIDTARTVAELPAIEPEGTQRGERNVQHDPRR